jgi:hypothetical protein
MATTGYSAVTQADSALSAATAKSILGVTAPAQFGVSLRGFQVSLNGVTASAVPVLVELCAATFATNGPGTNSTSATVQQDSGRSITAGFTAAYSWSTEPTVLTVVENFLITPNAGSLLYDYPLEREPDNAVSTGFVLRLTAPATVSARATMKFGRC